MFEFPLESFKVFFGKIKHFFFIYLRYKQALLIMSSELCQIYRTTVTIVIIVQGVLFECLIFPFFHSSISYITRVNCERFIKNTDIYRTKKTFLVNPADVIFYHFEQVSNSLDSVLRQVYKKTYDTYLICRFYHIYNLF